MSCMKGKRRHKRHARVGDASKRSRLVHLRVHITGSDVRAAIFPPRPGGRAAAAARGRHSTTYRPSLPALTAGVHPRWDSRFSGAEPGVKRGCMKKTCSTFNLIKKKSIYFLCVANLLVCYVFEKLPSNKDCFV